MSTDHLTSFSRALLRIYGFAQSLPVESFQDAALEAIRDILPFNSSMWGSATMSEQGIDIHTLHLHNTTTQMIDDYEKVKHLDHFAQEVVSKETNTIRFSAKDARSKSHYDFLEKYGHHHGLISQSINRQTHFVQWLSLFRSDPNHICDEREVELLAKLFPHLMQALAINRKVHMEQLLGNENRSRWSVAIADHHGFLYHADQQFLEILSKDYDLHNSERLPAGLLDAFTLPFHQLIASNSVISCSMEKDLLFLKARVKVPVDGLGEREFVIAKMLASGMSLKEIAKNLSRSPDTIRSYIKAIYQKLGTNKVTQLSALLMQQE